jgi:hypothetical protein
MTWEGLQSLPQRQRRSRPPDQVSEDLRSEKQPSVHVEHFVAGGEKLQPLNVDDEREILRSSAEDGCSYECKTLLLGSRCHAQSIATTSK